MFFRGAIKEWAIKHDYYEIMTSFVNVYFFSFFKVNVFKTIYYNFKAFPLRIAKYLPIVIGKNVTVDKIGHIEIEGDILPGMISIALLKCIGWENNKENTIIHNEGLIVFKGRIKIHPGAKIYTKNGAKLSFGGSNTIGSCTRLLCYKCITIGEKSGCSWDCEIFDTDFHFLFDMMSNTPLKRTIPVKIGNSVFIGNSSCICKGVKIPDGCVISSWTKVISSFTKEGTNLLIMGNPARVVDRGYRMASGVKEEAEIELLLEK